MSPITFTDEDVKGVDPSQSDPMAISVDVEKFTIMKTLVDQESSINILYWKMLKHMRIVEEEMKLYDDQVVGLSGYRVGTRGYIDLYTMFSEARAS